MSDELVGHIQWNGKRWQPSLTFNPNAKCEFDDHRSCADWSKNYTANLDAQGKADLDAAKAAQQAQVEQAASDAADQADQDDLNEAGQRKHEATRQNGLTKGAAITKAQDAAAEAIKDSQEAADNAKKKALADLDEATVEAVNDHVKNQNAINAFDWLGQVKGERAAALKAKADAKAAQDAADAANAKAAQDAADAANTKTAQDATKPPVPFPEPVAPTPEAPAPVPDPAPAPQE